MAEAVSLLSTRGGDLEATSAVMRKGELLVLCQENQG